jgi:putative iron-regulated protein
MEKFMTTYFQRAGLRASATIVALALSASTGLAQAEAPSAEAVLTNYADIAQAGYEDSLTTARALDNAIDGFLAAPSEETLQAAKDAWRAARVPYQQTEAYRFGNAIVDDWEGRVNSWPLDEGLIDYVDVGYGTESDENELYVANVIANPTIKIAGEDVDASKITPEFLSGTLQEAGDIEANVATGYHAIEFLLWGQDLHGTGPGAGERPYTDYDKDNCTHGNCDRRAAYLKAAATLLVSDLKEMTENWGKDGAARTVLLQGRPAKGLTTILTGMGSLSYGELAGERMKLGLLLHDPEEEHDCFSDNTYNSHYYDALGIQNVYLGRYVRVDGSEVIGPSVSELVKERAPEVDEKLRAELQATVNKMDAMKVRGEGGEAYDQMIGEGNTEGNAMVQAAIDALITQTGTIEEAVAALDLETIAFEGSDSLDNPDAVFQ